MVLKRYCGNLLLQLSLSSIGDSNVFSEIMFTWNRMLPFGTVVNVVLDVFGVTGCAGET